MTDVDELFEAFAACDHEVLADSVRAAGGEPYLREYGAPKLQYQLSEDGCYVVFAGSGYPALSYRNTVYVIDPVEVQSWVECTCDDFRLHETCLHGYIIAKSIATAVRAHERQPEEFFSSWAEQTRASCAATPLVQARYLGGLLYELPNPARLGPLPQLVYQPLLFEPQESARARKPRSFQCDADRSFLSLPLEDQRRLVTLCETAPCNARELRGRVGIPIRSAAQEDVVREMVASGRLYWGAFKGQPLQLGPEIAPTYTWRLTQPTVRRLLPVTPDGRALSSFYLGATAWYFKESTGIFGPVADKDRLLAALSAPAVTPRVINRVRNLWKSLDVPFEAPPLETSVEVIDVSPRAVLSLRAAVAADGRVLPIAELRFSYDGHLLAPSEPGVEACEKQVGDSVVRVLVRHVVEEGFQDALARSGFVSAARVRSDAVPVPTRGDQFILAWEEQRADLAAFMRGIDRCEAAGFKVLNELPGCVVPEKAIANMAILESTGIGGGWFDLALDIEVDGRRINVAPLIAQALSDPDFTLTPNANEPEDCRWTLQQPDGELLRVPLAQMRQLVAPVAEWVSNAKPNPEGNLKIGRLQAAYLAEAHNVPPPASISHLAQGIAKLRTIADQPLPQTPPGFEGELRPYQLEGLRWLNALGDVGLGGILADDMGLGKTWQLLAHLVYLKHTGQLAAPVLIIVPTSLVSNWRDEIHQRAPSLRLEEFHGSTRGQRRHLLSISDVVVTTYSLVTRESTLLESIKFSIVATDESQAIKNPLSAARKATRRLEADRFICVTGTPVENRLTDLWSLMDLSVPGLLGERQQFGRIYATPIEKHADEGRRARLTARTQPFVLRRTKAQVAHDLPPKIEITRNVTLEGGQRELYESVRATTYQEVMLAAKTRGLNAIGAELFEALLKLRQVCCAPRIVKLEAAQNVVESAKLTLLLDMVREAISEGHRILVFSSFVSMLNLIAEAVARENIGYQMLTGKTRNREAVINAFRTGDDPLFLLSLKAGGAGLNLQEADTVIHYDPWWNPAAENQATDRAHRIGQDQPVTVYRLIAEGTVESRIAELQNRKSALAESVLDGGSTTGLTNLTFDDVENLFRE